MYEAATHGCRRRATTAELADPSAERGNCGGDTGAESKEKRPVTAETRSVDNFIIYVRCCDGHLRLMPVFVDVCGGHKCAT